MYNTRYLYVQPCGTAVLGTAGALLVLLLRTSYLMLAFFFTIMKEAYFYDM